ncbi:hypothetical protein D3C81_1638650 [compost metagenome]
MAAVEGALADRVDQVERLDHGARRQQLDLEFAAGHVVDLLDEVARELVKNILGGPGALPTHRHGALRLDDGREAHRRGTHGGGACTAHELAS